MSNRRSYTKVIGPCDTHRSSRAHEWCEAAPYQVPWMTGTTGPTGPSGTTTNGQTDADQSMLSEYSTTNVNYPLSLPAPGNVLLSIESDDPYFSERFQGMSVSNSTTIGFTATVKMEYGARGVVEEADDASFGTYSSIAILSTGKPAILYVTSTGGTVSISRNSEQDGRGTWTKNGVISSGPTLMILSQLLVTVTGTPGFFRHLSGNFNILYYSSATADGGFGTWTLNTVMTPGVGESTTSMAGSINGFGFPCVVTGILSGGSTDLTYYVADDTTWTTWTATVIATELVTVYALSMALQSGNTMAVVYFNGTVLKYRSTSSITGTGGWQVRPNIDTNANIETSSVQLFIILSNGLPAVFYKVTGVNGITLAINSATDGSGTWTLYQIITDLVSFASTRQTLFPVNLHNGDIGLMYTSASGLMFGIASPSTPGTWTTHLVDDTLTGSGYYPSGAQLLNGYLAVAFTAYDSVATIVYGRSAILNDLRYLDETDFTLNWLVPS